VVGGGGDERESAVHTVITSPKPCIVRLITAIKPRGGNLGEPGKLAHPAEKAKPVRGALKYG
jgi:hypothetical protein